MKDRYQSEGGGRAQVASITNPGVKWQLFS